MCQLLGMSCNVPTDICFSFGGFSLRGGATDEHADGWGIAFFEGTGVRLFLDAQPSNSSPIAELVRQYPIKSRTVIAHIRKATQGQVALENCHPFQRELWGSYWVFAHNGNLPGFSPSRRQGWFSPVGATDSEAAFCHILEQLRLKHPAGRPAFEALVDSIAEVAGELRQLGTFNFLLSEGSLLFAFCSTKLSYVLRQAPFQSVRLLDKDLCVDFRQVTQPEDRVTVIATTPLTDGEVWTSFEPNELLVFQAGAIVARRSA